MAVRPEAPADRARGREPRLGDVLRHRHRRHARGLWQPGRAADPPGVARLAGNHAGRVEVGPEGARSADRALGDVPPILSRQRTPARGRSGEPVARARTLLPAPGRADPRQRTCRERAAGPNDWWEERLSVPAEGTVGGARDAE